jgi:hypothetical protein
MSRSGYSDDGDGDQWQFIMYRGAVNSAIKGKRGQQLLRELIAGLDAMADKRLVAGHLEADGEYCALGVVGAARGLNLSSIDTWDSSALSKNFDIAEAMAREVMWINDESVSGWEWIATGKPYPNEWERVEVKDAGARRWQAVRDWAVRHLAKEPA